MLASFLLLGALPVGVLGNDILQTNGFTMCSANPDVQVKKLNIQYNRAKNKVVFDVDGSSFKEQKVMARITVTAYGKEVYKKEFNPCDEGTKVEKLCPVPAGDFAASGEQDIPANYASQIPSIAFTIPDLDGQAKLELNSIEGGNNLACIQSNVDNGKSMNLPAVKYVAVGVAGAALALSGLSSLGAGAHGAGGATPSPSFGEVVGWFQSMAMNGMMSVKYPGVYQSFTKNFAFSGGLVQWDGMQISIDNFRKATGGNLTENSVAYLRNATLVTSPDLGKRGLEALHLFAREVSTTINGTTTGDGNSTSSEDNQITHYVKGIQAYVEELTIPQANTFMTVLLIFAIVIAAIAVGILLTKVILDTWALFGNFPQKLTSFRKRYWWLLAKTITNLILLLYGIWTLYCVYQFTNGDSWAAKALAGVTLAMFTGVLVFFTFRIWQLANKYKKLEGDASALFEDKNIWMKYSLFYDSYKKSYWWIFVPAIVYMFAKGCVIAGADGHGLAQSAGQLIIESLLLILLLWSRPYTLKSGNWINIIIQVVRVLSVVCILVFVEELGVSQTTQTVTGVVLVVMQSVLTGVLAILIAVNSIIMCCRENPHRKRRKEAEKLNRDLDNLTPLDARNSLLMDPTEYKGAAGYRAPMVSANRLSALNPISDRGYTPVPGSEHTFPDRPPLVRNGTQDPLLNDATGFGAELGHDRSRSHDRSFSDDQSTSPPESRPPRLPSMHLHNGSLGAEYRGVRY